MLQLDPSRLSTLRRASRSQARALALPFLRLPRTLTASDVAPEPAGRSSRSVQCPFAPSTAPTTVITADDAPSTSGRSHGAAADVVLRFISALNNRDLSSLLQLVADDCVHVDLSHEVEGACKEDVARFYSEVVASMPEKVRVVVDDMTSGDPTKVGLMWHMEVDGQEVPCSRGLSFYRVAPPAAPGRPPLIAYVRQSPEHWFKLSGVVLSASASATPIIDSLGGLAMPSFWSNLARGASNMLSSAPPVEDVLMSIAAAGAAGTTPSVPSLLGGLAESLGFAPPPPTPHPQPAYGANTAHGYAAPGHAPAAPSSYTYRGPAHPALQTRPNVTAAAATAAAAYAPRVPSPSNPATPTAAPAAAAGPSGSPRASPVVYAASVVYETPTATTVSTATTTSSLTSFDAVNGPATLTSLDEGAVAAAVAEATAAANRSLSVASSMDDVALELTQQTLAAAYMSAPAAAARSASAAVTVAPPPPPVAAAPVAPAPAPAAAAAAPTASPAAPAAPAAPFNPAALAGIWEKDLALSDTANYERALDAWQISGVQKATAKLIEGLELAAVRGALNVHFLTIIPYFKVTETYPLGGGKAKMRRRDQRGGDGQASAELLPDGVLCRCTWAAPFAGTMEEAYCLPDPRGSPDVMHVTSTLRLADREPITTLQVYNRRRGMSAKELISSSERRNGKGTDVLKKFGMPV
ncbi:hypothetical protein HYH03_011851 [Edaphochlamys debaryana]|uniref:SnoaL-like domain-containing protein n=1 Tax=Edaphochlamys debaryana TaxID=47281 RepID=A0A836BW53_9CHLO|nr:hypothetical protein HYH03_011851 [Edaphochlamys debaryana]|eukprot:KAG2489744.1 hypothetical protein HYH03_011851 [Edaphochlamys debaryana]